MNLDDDDEFYDYYGDYENQDQTQDDDVQNLTIQKQNSNIQRENYFDRNLDIDVFKIDQLKCKRNQLCKKLNEECATSLEESELILIQSNWNLQQAKQYVITQYKWPQIIEINRINCPVCFEQNVQWITLMCGHSICKECFQGFVESAIQDGIRILTIKCWESKCQQRIAPMTIEKYLDDQLKSRLDMIVNNNLLDFSKTFKRCPKPDCQWIFTNTDSMKTFEEPEHLSCPCDYTFCSICQKEAHKPISCSNLKKWAFYFEGENTILNEQWIAVNSKLCPKCKVPIQKNQGCMHMTCINCKHEFCYVCFATWFQHTTTIHTPECNSFQQQPQRDENINQMQRDLEKVNFYNDRMQMHLKAVQIAREKRQEKLNLHFQNTIVIEEYYQKALDLVINSRRAIAYTYPQAFFISDESQLAFFQFQQEELLRCLDHLDELTDNQIIESQDNYNNFIEWKKNVKDLTSNLKKYVVNVLQCFENA